MNINNIKRFVHAIFMCLVLITLAGIINILMPAPDIYCSFPIHDKWQQEETNNVSGYTFSKYIGRTTPMWNINKDFHFSIPDPQSMLQRFKTTRRDPQILEIRRKLMDANLWENPEVQHKFRIAKLGTEKSSKKARTELLELIEDHKELSKVLDDPCMPYATADQISNQRRGIHLLDQAYNNIPLFIEQTTLILKGLMVIGRPGYGKSSAVYNIFNQVTVPYLCLDPKASWKQACMALGSKYIDWDSLYLCLRPPNNISWEHWLFVVSDAICHATGLQYSQDLIIEAGQICLRQKRDFEASSGTETSISLKDLKLALNLCSTKNPKRAQYLESAKAALSLLVGSEDQHIFAARSGLPWDSISKDRYFMGCEYANSYQSRFLGLNYFLYQKYSSIGKETNQLGHFTAVDDASRFISQITSIFGSGGQYGPWMNILKVLRASGEGYIFVDQLCSPILKEIKQLVNCWLVIGSIGHKEELDAIAAAMNLNTDQRNMLTKLGQRECVFYCPEIGRPIHGYIPIVNRPC
jgi:hypothetical protein